MKIYIGAPSLLCPLGSSLTEVHNRMSNGESGLTPVNHFGKKVFAGRMDDSLIVRLPNRTVLESMMIQVIRNSLHGVDGMDLSETQVFVCTTKGNVDHISDPDNDTVALPHLSKVLKQEFGFATMPQIISHACISGIMGVVTAARWIKAKKAKHCIVVGGDLASEFVLSGFMSLHAVSAQRGKPYDKNRDGINLGQASACLVISNAENIFKNDHWVYKAGNVTNDANHISGPSRTGEGLHRSIQKTLAEAGTREFDLISAHGTGTVFNDEMESIAFDRSGILDKPVHSLKWFLGHTLGTAGLVETVLELESLRVNQLIPSGGFEQLGTSGNITVIEETGEKNLNSFLKTASGFGGCNASMLIAAAPAPSALGGASIINNPSASVGREGLVSWARISNGTIKTSNGNIEVNTNQDSLLVALYRKLELSYPKFFKMDDQSKLGFLGSQLLLRNYAEELQQNDEAVALVFANSTSSLKTDREYLATVGEEGTGSPAKFVYTLPNVVVGEVCIYWKQYNETQFLVLPEFDAQTLLDHAQIMFSESNCKYVLIGWTEVGLVTRTTTGSQLSSSQSGELDGFFALLSKNDGNLVSVEELSQLYNR